MLSQYVIAIMMVLQLICYYAVSYMIWVANISKRAYILWLLSLYLHWTHTICCLIPYGLVTYGHNN